jgi:hypothetical protein
MKNKQYLHQMTPSRRNHNPNQRMNVKKRKNKATPQGRIMSLSLKRACQVGEEVTARIIPLIAVTIAASVIVMTVDLART